MENTTVELITTLPSWMDDGDKLRISHASWVNGKMRVSDQYGFLYEVQPNGDWLCLDGAPDEPQKVYASGLVAPMR